MIILELHRQKTKVALPNLRGVLQMLYFKEVIINEDTQVNRLRETYKVIALFKPTWCCCWCRWCCGCNSRNKCNGRKSSVTVPWKLSWLYVAHVMVSPYEEYWHPLLKREKLTVLMRKFLQIILKNVM